MAAAVQQVMECPLCWVRRHEVHNLRRVGLGWWKCEACEAELLAGERDMPKPAVVMERYPNGDRAPKVKKITGARTGRRRKKPRKREPWYQVVR